MAGRCKGAGWRRARAGVYARDISRSPSSAPAPSSAAPDAIDASDARAILGDAPSTFEHRRRALELILDRTTGARSTVPTFEDPNAERASRARACLIVPEWGGIKLPGGQWQYSRRRLLAFLADPYEAVVCAGSVAPRPSRRPPRGMPPTTPEERQEWRAARCRTAVATHDSAGALPPNDLALLCHIYAGAGGS